MKISELIMQKAKNMRIEKIVLSDSLLLKYWTPASIWFEDTPEKYGRMCRTGIYTDLAEENFLGFYEPNSDEDFFTEDKDFYLDMVGHL